MLDKKPNLGRTISLGIFGLIIIGITAFLLLNQQYVKDQIVVWSYTPENNIQLVEERIGFTDKGQFYFYATRPVLDSTEQFNADCPRQEVRNPILGCYAAGRIYVYDVTNPQLDGIEEVTVAHEMLHAVWERMSADEQQRVGALLETKYKTLTSDVELKQRMDYYERTEPGQFTNELHSILATEFSDLGTELDEHYAEYFKDRQKVLDLHANYNVVFKDLKSRSDALYAELTTLGTGIEARSAKYDTDVKQLSADIESFNTKATNGDFTSASQFNSQRAALVNRSNKLDAERISIGNDIDSYNAKYTEYQKLSSDIESLNTSIDSIKALQPAPSI